MLLTCRSTVFSLNASSRAMLLLGLPAGNQPEHLQLALGEAVLGSRARLIARETGLDSLDRDEIGPGSELLEHLARAFELQARALDVAERNAGLSQ